MKRHGLIILVCILCGLRVYGEAPSEFQNWLKQDSAMQQGAASQVTVGDFRVPLPLGWIRDSRAEGDGVRLAYVGPRATTDPPQVRASLNVSTEAIRTRGGPAEAWPSAFSGWTTFQMKDLWGVRAVLPGARAGASRLAVQIPTSLATLTIEVDVPQDAGPWPDYMEPLIQGLVYMGTGVPLAPPEQAGAKSRAAARSPQIEISPQALASSPLRRYVAKTRQALHKGVDPATENYVSVLDTGADALLARVHLIRAATQSIRIQTYIWGDDEVGRLLLYELVEAAKRGVQVQIIIDHFASFRNVELAAFVSTASPNLVMRHYRPAAKRMDPAALQESLDLLIPNGTNQRMHNKVFIVDDVAVITGGRNIDNSYYGQSDTINFRDRDVLFMGPMAAYAVRSFGEYWAFDKCKRTTRLKDVKKVIKSGKFKRLESRDDFDLHGYFSELEESLADPALIEKRLSATFSKVDNALFLADPPGKKVRRYTAWRRGTISRQLESLMAAAENSLLIQTPYLVLDGGMLKIFKELREENPNIELLASSNSCGATDNTLAYSANFKMRPVYVRAGVNVYEYMQIPDSLAYQLPNYETLLKRNEASRAVVKRGKPFLCIHSKAMVVDGIVAYVGSYNFDPRSISLNTEVGLLVQDPAFADRLQRDIRRDSDPGNSWVVTKRKEPLPAKDIQRNIPRAARKARIDLWPFRNTTGYELKSGQQPVPPATPLFYSNYDDIGIFPGAEDQDDAMRRVLTHLSAALSGLMIPLL